MAPVERPFYGVTKWGIRALNTSRAFIQCILISQSTTKFVYTTKLRTHFCIYEAANKKIWTSQTKNIFGSPTCSLQSKETFNIR